MGNANRPRLDKMDLKILSVLQRNGRITKLALADEVGLSPTPCYARVKRMEEAGIIRGYRAEIAPEVFAPQIIVWTEIVLRSHRYEDFAHFEAAVRRVPEMVECWAVGGGIDYLIRFDVPSIEAFQEIMDGNLGRSFSINRYYSYIVTKKIKHDSDRDLSARIQEQLRGAAQKAETRPPSPLPRNDAE